MSLTKRWSIATLSLLALFGCARPPAPVTVPMPWEPPSASTLTIDLAEHSAGTYATPRGALQVEEILIVNLLPEPTRYNIAVQAENRPMEVLQHPTSVPTVATVSLVNPLDKVARPPKPCEPEERIATKFRDGLEKASTEAGVGALFRDLRAAERVASTTCRPVLVAADVEGQRLTTRRIVMGPLRANQDLVVTVSRAGATLEWKNTYAGRSDGEWRVLYAFAGLVNAWPAYSYSSEEIAAADGAAAKFTIREQRTRSPISLVPAVQYVFNAADPDAGWLRWHWTAGLGVDLTKPTVFGGVTRVYHENVAFTFGGMLHPIRVLADKYEKGQTIATSLDNEQLTQPAYRVNPFIALSFRFGSTPFSIGSTSAHSTTETKTEGPATKPPPQ